MKRRGLLRLAAGAIGVPLLMNGKPVEALDPQDERGQEFAIGGYRVMFRFTPGGQYADGVCPCDGDIDMIAVLTQQEMDAGKTLDTCPNVLSIGGGWPNAEVWVVYPPQGAKTEEPPNGDAD